MIKTCSPGKYRRFQGFDNKVLTLVCKLKEISKGHQVKDEVVIVGDSMIKNIDPRGLSRKNNTLVKSYSGAKNKNIVDFVKPAEKRKVLYYIQGQMI